MRLKQEPGDFVVKEDFHFVPDDEGKHFVHVLTKEKLDTLSALTRLARAAGVARTDIAFAGLKDRQGITEQWISIPGKRADLDEHGLKVRFVGRSAEPVTSKSNEGNRFRITVRDLTLHEAARMRRNLPAVKKAGLPNYFDDQRFGCLTHGQGFIVRDLLRGKPERALRQLIAQPSPRAIAGDTKLKQILARHWGDWESCARIARGPMYREMFAHLKARPTDFAGAIEKLTPRLKLIHLYAYQSWIWNRTVSRYLERFVSTRERTWLRTLSGDLLAWRYLDQETPGVLMSKSLPLIADTTEFEDRLFRAMNIDLLEEEGLSLPRLQVRIRGFAFKEELRPLVLRPMDLRVSRFQSDEVNPGRSKLVIEFGLPRGAYATLVVKRLFADPVRALPDGGVIPYQDREALREERRARSRGRGSHDPMKWSDGKDPMKWSDGSGAPGSGAPKDPMKWSDGSAPKPGRAKDPMKWTDRLDTRRDDPKRPKRKRPAEPGGKPAEPTPGPAQGEGKEPE